MADLTAAQLTALATEINTDPKVLGYPGKTNAQCAAILNTVGASSETIASGIVSSQVIMNALVESEMEALSTAKLNVLNTYITAGFIDTSNANVKTGFGAIFAAGTVTHTNLVALLTRSATRAEVLFGSGVNISYSNVGQALNRAS